MADVEGAGRVDAPEFHLEPLAVPDVARAVARPDAADQAAEPVVGETEVHVAPRSLGRRRTLGDLDRLGQPCRDHLRVLAHDARELQARGRGVIAVLSNFRAPELEVRHLAVDPQLAHGLQEGIVDAVTDSA